MSVEFFAALALGAAVVIGIASAPLSLTRRAGILLIVAALAALAFGTALTIVVVVGVLIAFAVDSWWTRPGVHLDRRVPHALARGVPAELRIDVHTHDGAQVTVRQPQVPDVQIEPAEGDGGLIASVVARRRGRHILPAVATRRVGPLGLAAWFRTVGEPTEVHVYPDLPAARRLALAVRQGRFRDPGRLTRGPLGLGTDFESIRDYLPDDDIRQVNWRATQRAGRPMSNQYRVEQDRDVMCVIDTGRLMGAPLGDRTRLDAALDAAVAVAVVTEEVGDRCGVVAFDDSIRAQLAPRRSGGDAVVRATFDLEPTRVDADYELAFRTVGGGKRALVMVFTDLIDDAAADALIDAVPVLVRRHAVVVASSTDPDLSDFVTRDPVVEADVYAAAIATEVLAVRARVAARLRRSGADVLEAPPEHLAAACVGAYLRAKARARV